MADADEPWIREWINSVADDMMREHSYMEMSLRGSELGKCESYGNWRNLCVLVGREHRTSPGK